jgi:hypothetical protein
MNETKGTDHMTGLNYADAGGQNDFSELVPHGTLSWAILKLRWYNFDMGIVETPSKSSDAAFLDCELTLVGGDWHGRKVWTRIGTKGSEKYVNMGRAAIRGILEAGFGANPQTNPQGYTIANYSALDKGGEGVKVGIKIKIEPGKDGYQDKNDVAVWLTPNPDGGTRKDWDRLMLGDTKPSAHTTQPRTAGGAAAPAAQAGPSWAQGQPAQNAPTQAAPAPAPSTAPPGQGAQAGSASAPPSWLTNQPGTPDQRG